MNQIVHDMLTIMSPAHHALRHRVDALSTQGLRAFLAWATCAEAEGRPVAYRAMAEDDLAYWNLILTQVEQEERHA